MKVPRKMDIEFTSGVTAEYISGLLRSFGAQFAHGVQRLEVIFNDEVTSVTVFHVFLMEISRFHLLDNLEIHLNNYSPIQQGPEFDGVLPFSSLLSLKINSKRNFSMNYLKPLGAPNLMSFELILESDADLSDVEQTRIWDYIVVHDELNSVHLDFHNDYLFSWKEPKKILHMISCYEHSEYISKLFETQPLHYIKELIFIDSQEKIVKRDKFDEYYSNIFKKLERNISDCDLYITTSLVKLIKSPLLSVYRANIYIEEEEDPLDFLAILGHFKTVCPNVEKMRYNHVDLVFVDNAVLVDHHFVNMGSIRYLDMDPKIYPLREYEFEIEENPAKKMRLY